MFSGKTTALIDHCKANETIEPLICCKPAKDTRYGTDSIDTHSGLTFPATPIKSIAEVVMLSEKFKHIVIDEVQFFDTDVESTISKILDQGKKVTLSGLEFDALHREFGHWVNLFEKANVVIRKTGQCAVCDKPATHTFRKTYTASILQLGAEEAYEPRCELCHQNGLKKQLEMPLGNNPY